MRALWVLGTTQPVRSQGSECLCPCPVTLNIFLMTYHQRAHSGTPDSLPGTVLWFHLCLPLSPVPLWAPTAAGRRGAAEITSPL